MRQSKPTACELCGSTSDHLNFHHLIPRALHGKKWFTERYTREFMKTHGAWLCKFYCHKEIHTFIDERSMGRQYNTVEALLTHPAVAGYVRWRSARV